MCLCLVPLFPDCQPLILKCPKASGDLGQRALDFPRVHALLLQLGNDLLLSGHEARTGSYVVAYQVRRRFPPFRIISQGRFIGPTTFKLTHYRRVGTASGVSRGNGDDCLSFAPSAKNWLDRSPLSLQRRPTTGPEAQIKSSATDIEASHSMTRSFLRLLMAFAQRLRGKETQCQPWAMRE